MSCTYKAHLRVSFLQRVFVFGRFMASYDVCVNQNIAETMSDDIYPSTVSTMAKINKSNLCFSMIKSLIVINFNSLRIMHDVNPWEAPNNCYFQIYVGLSLKLSRNRRKWYFFTTTHHPSPCPAGAL